MQRCTHAEPFGEPSRREREEDAFDYEQALADCAAGDDAAFQRLYEREAPRLLGVALRIVRRRDVAHDVVHDSFLRIWRGAATFDRHRGSGRAWIFTIVRHRALNVVRDRRRETDLDEGELEAVPDPTPPVNELFERMSEHSALRGCLERLEPRRRQIILLAYVDGLSQSQIASRLEVPLGSVKAWVRRSLLALKECLS